MNQEGAGSAPSTLSFDEAAQVDAICDRFEQAWRAGEGPAIEHFLADVGEPARASLLAELLAVDVALRRQRGERPAAQEYLGRFPDHAALVLAAIAEAETLPQGRNADTPGAPPGPRRGVGWVGLRYSIVKRHARGGLGEVFLAHDETLNREVALKQIRPEYAESATCQARFLREAEITGRLEHPGIVPIHGLGRLEDGRPFYVMPFIRGESLHDVIERFHRDNPPAQTAASGTLGLEFRTLLARFLDVCNAVDYAHNQGVLHRDLKPSNVMVGPFGETLVVDWGLAKVQGRPDSLGGHEPSVTIAQESASTVPGSALGTPHYMSPEQASGQLDQIGPPSDVYSLGAMLYCLLTGRAPFDSGDQRDLLERVRRGEFPPPRASDRRVPPALEAVCLQAMALKPDNRYASARALAADVERWLADLPVSIYRESLAARAARWARRHKPVVAGLTALLLTALVALAASTWLVNGQRRRAETARGRAQINFARALDAVDQMLNEVGAVQLVDVPQMEPVRRRLLEKALRYYQELLAEQPADRAVFFDVSRAHARLGSIYELQGDAVAAERAYRQSIRLFHTMSAAAAGSPQALAELARAHDGLGVLLKKSNRFLESEGSLRLALAIRARLAGLTPAVPLDHEALAESRYHLGTLLARLPGRGPADEQAYREAVTLQSQLVASARSEPASRGKLVRYLNNLGILMSEAGRRDEAEAHFREALALLELLLAGDPALPAARWQMARTEANLAVLLRASGRDGEAESRLRRALELQNHLAADFPGVPEYRHELAAILNNLGLLLTTTGRPQPAADALGRASELRQRLAAEFPNYPDYVQKLAVTRVNLALALEQSDQGAASRAYRDALVLQAELTSRFPMVAEYRIALGRTSYTMARLTLRDGDLAAARALLEEAVLHHRTALELDDRSRTCREYLRDDHGVLAIVLIRLKEHALAAQSAADLPRVLPDSGLEYARAAGFLVQCCHLARQDETVAEPLRALHGEPYLQEAVDLLRQAFTRKLLKNPAILGQPEFNPLRDRIDFQELQSDLERAARTETY
jgi:eukaryotic-like serine/threonine-protein kinase